MPKRDGLPIGWSGPDTVNSGPQLVRDTMRKTTLSNFQTEVTKDKGTAHLAIDALGETGNFLNDLESDISLIGPNLKKQQLAVKQSAPGHYELAIFRQKTLAPISLISCRNRRVKLSIPK